ncbi:hypothetical protein [Kitasatospora sp. MBT63]|uniref:hypothetical protein n=1 Tax=Kitasatospora sp. MBT63 TaxID=1444768 RepID=UPI000539741B|nr:hypothetical protein [Kitasatospora sp. MBT63]
MTSHPDRREPKAPAADNPTPLTEPTEPSWEEENGLTPPDRSPSAAPHNDAASAEPGEDPSLEPLP